MYISVCVYIMDQSVCFTCVRMYHVFLQPHRFSSHPKQTIPVKDNKTQLLSNETASFNQMDSIYSQINTADITIHRRKKLFRDRIYSEGTWQIIPTRPRSNKYMCIKRDYLVSSDGQSTPVTTKHANYGQHLL